MDIMERVGTEYMGAVSCNPSFGSDLWAKFPPASTRGTKYYIPALACVTRSNEICSKATEIQRH